MQTGSSSQPGPTSKSMAEMVCPLWRPEYGSVSFNARFRGQRVQRVPQSHRSLVTCQNTSVTAGTLLPSTAGGKHGDVTRLPPAGDLLQICGDSLMFMVQESRTRPCLWFLDGHSLVLLLLLGQCSQKLMSVWLKLIILDTGYQTGATFGAGIVSHQFSSSLTILWLLDFDPLASRSRQIQTIT